MSNDVSVYELPLPDLAEQINAFSQKAESYARHAVDIAIAAGNLLCIAKSKVPHGGWDDWLTQNCTLAPRTARAYMRLADKFPSLPEPERQRVADLPVREAIKAITTTADAPPRPATWVYPKRTDAERCAEVLRKSASAMRDVAKWVSGSSMLPGKKIAGLRTKLQAALEELDRLESDSQEAAS